MMMMINFVDRSHEVSMQNAVCCGQTDRALRPMNALASVLREMHCLAACSVRR